MEYKVAVLGGPDKLRGREFYLPLSFDPPLDRFRIVGFENGYYEYIATSTETERHHYWWETLTEGDRLPPFAFDLEILSPEKTDSSVGPE